MLKRLLKTAAKLTGVLATDDTGTPVKARKLRLAASALVVALLVSYGVDVDVATAVGDVLAALVE